MSSVSRPSCISDIKPFINMELERKRELERRKILRLLQVRQQSNDFSSKLRKSIQTETLQEKTKFLETKRKLIQKQQVEEMNKLKELYQKTLHEVGESHRDAAKQPNVNFIKEVELARITAEAALRGAKARKQQLKKETQVQQIIEAPAKRKKATRNKENLRSFFISSLPKHTKKPENHTVSATKQSTKTTETNINSPILHEIPSNLSRQQPRKPVCITPAEEVRIRKNINETHQEPSKRQKFDLTSKTTHQSKKDQITSPKECSCDYVVCSCHNSPREIKRRCYSESRVSSEISETEEVETKRVKLRSRSCSPRSVKTLNYIDVGNLYESNQPSFVRVTHHCNSSNVGEETVFSNPEPKFPSERNISCEELKKKTEERSSKALQREQLKRDFQQLLQDLGNLAREKRVLKNRTKKKTGVYQRERDILEKNEVKQRKLTDAFETLLHTVKHSQHQNTGLENQTHLSTVAESSPPTLNLALYQQISMSSRGPSPHEQNMVRRLISCEEITISQTSIPGQTRSQSPPSRSSPERSARSPSRRSPQSSGRTPTSSSKPPPYSYPSSGSSQPKGRLSPEVSVRTDPSGDVHLIVKGAEPKQHKKKCKRAQFSPPMDSSTSYFSPPENLSPSQKLLLDALLIQVNKKSLNEDLKLYIKKLLTMSRESIDELDVSSSSGNMDSARSPEEKEIQEDIAKLSNLTELYADKVNTLVDMFEQFEQLETPEMFSNPPQFNEPGPSTSSQSYMRPPQKSPNVYPSRLRQPQPRRASPSPVARQTPPSATARQTPPSATARQTPPSTAGRQTPQSRARQTPSRRTPSPVQRVPRKPTTPPIQRRSRKPLTPMPQVRQVGPPPGSEHSRIPRYPSPGRSPQPQRVVAPGPSGIQTPFGLSSNLLPHPREVFGQPNAATQPDFGFGAPQSPQQDIRLPPISESPEGRGFGSPQSPSPFGRSPQGQMFPSSPGAGQEDFPQTGGFVGDFGAQDDWGDVGFGDEEFGRGAEVILETEAPEEGHVDYPEDFPPPTDVFGPGFDWSTANMTDPSWPHSFPGDPLGGSEIADKSHYPIDTSLDVDAVTYPLNVERINEVRRKLSKICNDQYREIIEMLRKDYASGQDQLGQVLKRVQSDPFEDPNATLAPIRREQARPQSCGRTPEMSSSPTKSDKGVSLLNERIDNITSLSILAKGLDKDNYRPTK